MNGYNIGRNHALQQLKLSEVHVPPQPIDPSPVNPEDPGMIPAALGTFKRFGTAIGNAGVAAANGWHTGYNHNINAPMAARIGAGLAGIPGPTIAEFAQSGGLSATANIGAMGLSVYGAKRIYDDWKRRKEYEAQFHGME
jgi:hypothetical protein